jgi:hypothetical protein
MQPFYPQSLRPSVCARKVRGPPMRPSPHGPPSAAPSGARLSAPDRWSADFLEAHKAACALGQPLLTAAGVAYLQERLLAAPLLQAIPGNGTQSLGAAQSKAPLPWWDAEGRRLWLGGCVLKGLRQPAWNQTPRFVTDPSVITEERIASPGAFPLPSRGLWPSCNERNPQGAGSTRSGKELTLSRYEPAGWWPRVIVCVLLALRVGSGGRSRPSPGPLSNLPCLATE